jgi:hypothetical protein
MIINPPASTTVSIPKDTGVLTRTRRASMLNTIASFTNFEPSKSTPQYGFNRGMKEFGELGFEATMKELDDNLIGMGAVQMLEPNEVNKDVWCGALSYLMFLKRKPDGTVKARGCADGRPQREYISKDDSSSPTVSIYALMASCLMDAIDEQKGVTCDIPGAFLQADWPADQDCYLNFENVMVDMICQIDHKYNKNVIRRGSKKFIFAKLNSFHVMAPILAPLLGVIFYGGISSSKIGLRAPSLDRAQLRLNARVFLLSKKNIHLVRIAVTDSGISPSVLDHGRAPFLNAHQRCRFESGTCIIARTVARLKEFYLHIFMKVSKSVECRHISSTSTN